MNNNRTHKPCDLDENVISLSLHFIFLVSACLSHVNMCLSRSSIRHWAVPCGDWDVCDGSRREKNPNGGEDLAAYDQWVCPLFDGESVRKDQLYVSAPPSIWLVNEQTGFSGW